MDKSNRGGGFTTQAHSDRLIAKLDELTRQLEAIDAQLLTPEVQSDHRQVTALSMKRAAIAPLVDRSREYARLVGQKLELRQLLDEGAEPELAELAREELGAIEARAAGMLAAIQEQFVNAADRAVASIFLEVRAGVGGDEAAIWAGDLVDMYRRFASSRGFSVEDVQVSPCVMGGCKNAILRMTGEGVWAQLGFEGGTHQVKRVPATEAAGRVHTSTATVAVLPEPEEIEVKIEAGEVKEMVTTAQGPGGQNVNKVATAVHLIHLPTGIEVRMQDTKSQSQNREKAWRLLRARLYERQKAEAARQRSEARSSIIGGARRAEKIRTYRFKENLAVDHRLERTFNLSEIMAGRLQPLIEALIEQETARRLAEL